MMTMMTNPFFSRQPTQKTGRIKPAVSTPRFALMGVSLIKTVLLGAFAWSLAAFAQAPQFAQQFMILADQKIRVDIADTPSKREHGLMFRDSLTDQEGMLFVFPKSDRHCFWMKNTPSPLTIAFIDDTRQIIDVQPMQAQSETIHCPPTNIRYALELSQGWFDRHLPKKSANETPRIKMIGAWPRARQ